MAVRLLVLLNETETMYKATVGTTSERITYCMLQVNDVQNIKISIKNARNENSADQISDATACLPEAENNIDKPTC